MATGDSFLEEIAACQGLTEGIILLKVWLRQRGLNLVGIYNYKLLSVDIQNKNLKYLKEMKMQNCLYSVNCQSFISVIYFIQNRQFTFFTFHHLISTVKHFVHFRLFYYVASETRHTCIVSGLWKFQ